MRYHHLLFILIFTGFIGCRSSEPVPTAGSGAGGVVTAASPEAAQAGMEILRAGGNAIDAAAAVGFALGVTEPAMSGLGGQSQIILHGPGQPPLVLNGTSFTPHATPSDAQRKDLTGRRLTTIPTTVRVLHHAWETYGSGNITWQQILAPSIAYAEDGFVMGPFRYKVLERHADDLREDSATGTLFLNEDGSMPAMGDLVKQPLLARTLRRLAEHGADDFYSGDIARQIAADMKANNGWITLDDLNQVGPPAPLSPLAATYRGWDVYTLPPPGGGWVVLQMLNMLEQIPEETRGSDTTAHSMAIADVLRIGHRNRRDEPVKDLVNYMPEIPEKISKDAAQRLWNDSSGETTHYSVVDAAGMAVGVTASINAYFGARVAHPDLGFLYNSYMTEFEFDAPDHPFALRADAMPYSSMSPTILSKDGAPHLVLGSPGSARIMSAVMQVIHNWVDHNMTITEAVASHRMHVVPDNKLYMESQDIPDDLRQAAEARRFVITSPNTDLANEEGNPYFGGVHAIARKDRNWTGAADPRRDGAVSFLPSNRSGIP